MYRKHIREPKLNFFYRAEGVFTGGHEADALFFNCCDFRFRRASQEAVEHLPGCGTLVDEFVFPGGIMVFVGAKYGHEDMQKGAIYWTLNMIRLHKAKKVFFAVHGHNLGRCGAYETAPALLGKTAEEIYNHQVQDVQEVMEIIGGALEKEGVAGVSLCAVYMQADEDGKGVSFSEMDFGGEGGGRGDA